MFQLIPINKTVIEDEAQCRELKWYVQGPILVLLQQLKENSASFWNVWGNTD